MYLVKVQPLVELTVFLSVILYDVKQLPHEDVVTSWKSTF